MKVIHIIGEAPLYTNCFLLVGEAGHAVAIDPAADPEKFLETLREENVTLTHIFLTHGHPDHVGAVDALRDATGARVYMNEADARKYRPKPDVMFTDGEDITVDDMNFHVIFTPGHTPGSTCFLCGELFFTGDTVFAGDIGRCDLPGGDMQVMEKSLKKLVDTVQGNPQVIPGHDVFSSWEHEKQYNRYLRDV